MEHKGAKGCECPTCVCERRRRAIMAALRSMPGVIVNERGGVNKQGVLVDYRVAFEFECGDGEEHMFLADLDCSVQASSFMMDEPLGKLFSWMLVRWLNYELKVDVVAKQIREKLPSGMDVLVNAVGGAGSGLRPWNASVWRAGKQGGMERVTEVSAYTAEELIAAVADVEAVKAAQPPKA